MLSFWLEKWVGANFRDSSAQVFSVGLTIKGADGIANITVYMTYWRVKGTQWQAFDSHSSSLIVACMLMNWFNDDELVLVSVKPCIHQPRQPDLQNQFFKKPRWVKSGQTEHLTVSEKTLLIKQAVPTKLSDWSTGHLESAQISMTACLIHH